MIKIQRWVRENIPAEFDLNSFAQCQCISGVILYLFAYRLEVLSGLPYPSDVIQILLIFTSLIVATAGYRLSNFNPRRAWPEHLAFHRSLLIAKIATSNLHVILVILTPFKMIESSGLSNLAEFLICGNIILGWLSGFQEESPKESKEQEKFKV